MKSQIRVRWIMHVVVVAGIFAGAASSMVAADRAEGEPPSALGPVTYDYVANPGLAIPDNDPVGIRHTIYVPDSFFICGGDVDVDLGITHTWIGDLIIRVEHDGIQQEIWNRACGNTDNINSTADDQGSVTSCSAIAGGPINGVFWSPQFTNGGPLSVFRGDAQGNWTIEVIDAAGQDVGTLNQWSLHFHAPIECIPPPSGMVSWWPGEPGCGARDRLGRNDGTPHGAPTCPVDPKVGRGALGGFDSATQTYFSVPHTSSLSFGQGGLSVDLWVKTSSDGPLLEKGISSGPGFSFGIGSGKLYFSACDTSICIAPITSSATVSTGSWRHVAMTWGGPQGGIALYVDGQPDGASGAVLTTLDNVQALLIGASGPPGAPTAFFTGEMDEIEIFNRVLGDGEILELAEADCAGKCKCVQPPDNMIAWWPLDEVSGSIVRDLKSGNDGAPQPGPIGGAGNPAPVNGFVDGALDFDGTNFVRVPSAPSLNLGTSDFTIDAWVYYDAQSNPSYGRTLVAKHSDIGDGFQLMLLPGNFHLHMGPGAGLMFFGYCPTPDDAWSHYAVTVDQGKPNGIKYYLNGVLAGMQKTPDRVYDLGGNLDLFVATRAASLTYGAPLSGSVDELEIFRRALSADEIAAIYRASADGKCKEPPPDVRADIQVEKILLTPNPTAGSSVVFRVIVSNLGPAPASHILVRDLLPPGLIYQSHVAATGTYDPPTGQYDIPALATFTSTSMLITAILDSCDPLTNCATFLGHSVRDPNPANDSACVTVTAVSPCGAIRGLKFQDTNRDGSPSGDAPFSGQTIRLRNSSGTVKTQITPGSGQYSFSPLPPDTYKVTENLFYGQVQTAPLGGKHIINLASGAQLNGMDFGNYSCPSPPPSTCVPPPMDMVAWWPLDSIVSGSAGCAYSMDMIGEVADRVLGAPSGATSCGPTPAGAVDGAITFDGVDDYVEAQNRAALNFGAASCLPNVTNPNFTIDAYVKTSSTGTQMIVDKRREQSGTVQGYSLFTLGGRLWLQLATASGLSNYDSGASVNTNTWRHVAVTVDRCSPTGIKFYVDGVMAPNQGNPLARTGTLVNSFPLRIGRRSDSSNPGLFAGGIDEVEIFRSVLSQIDIQKIMDHGKCKRSRCHGPTAVTFCANETSKKVPVTICNWSGATDTFHWSVAGLWSGFPGGCSVEGPTDMSPQSGVTPPLPPGKCTTVIISVARPANLAPGQTTCFQTRVAEDSTGECFDCLTRATASTTWCMKGPGDFYQDVTIVPLDGSKTLGFEIRNDHAEFQTLNYEFEVVPSDTEAPPNQVVRLNGLPPGTPVTGSLQVPLEGVTTLSVDASYLHNDALQFYDVVLSLNDATQTLVPMGSVGLRSVNPDRTPDACDAALPSSQILLAWASKSYISWTGGACAGLYNVYRTTGVRLQDSDHDGLADSYGSCFDLGLTEPELFDRSVPSSGSLHFYLVSGMNAQGEGSLGTNRAGVQRPNVEPCSP